MHTPTHEQAAATEAFPTGAHLVIQAGAGTGKTTTLALLARTARRQGRRGRYLAFNKAVARHAARAFPAEVACGTAHSLAYTSVGRDYQARMNAPRQAGWRTGAALGIDEEMSVRLGARKVTNRALSHTVLRTVTRFCQPADEKIAPHHVPPLRGAESEPLQAHLAELTLPYARKAWADLQHPDHGVVRFEHDHYLKMWALRDPVIPADFLLLDEAQDTNPVVEQVFTAQRDHAQLVLVGDSAQAIYGWRGARDVMTGFDGRQLSLSRSFRFGPPLAAEANRWLTIIGAPIRLTGSPGLDTVLGTARAPDAILCRTNVGAMVEVIQQLDAGRRVALAGGGEALGALARAAHDLEARRRTAHPELMLFETWGELREYAEFDPAGRDLLPLVELIDEHGTEALLCTLDRLSPEDSAEVTVSTAHRAKGREWARVRIADDFTGPDDLDERDEDGAPVPGPIDLDEARLAYVAVTRARSLLDLCGLSWINSHPAGDPRPTAQKPVEEGVKGVERGARDR
ncbi:Superfamily I DNA and RNA helicases [Streptomyces sp. SceaMP-e96]|uniref:UvrD-helicase domain-containing protein n=1 Tax=unclassified Streptomyces TaxID=2593676 RepID=UPI000823E975|nr:MULTISPECIES: UvrD-helicase domain-containing protein [unclassified Streptomyces]MYT17577.1 UvrD-helicase domain-containing protein [Streptomyces sp. SID4951]SCK43101.1 Superfamily I DNA and RNA helicases [Streptomyces sp. SceaMP-e96]